MSNCSASVENSLREIAIELRAIRKEISLANRVEPVSENSLICKCGNCGTQFVAELPDNIKVVVSDNPYQE